MTAVPAARERRSWWVVPGIFAATLLAYLPALRAGLIWDDDAYVTAPALRSFAGLRLIWTKVGATEQYYPLLHSAFWLQYRLWGGAPWAYHLFNVLAHAACASLLVVSLRRIHAPGARWAGLIFALHPVCVESVAWVSEEKNTLSLAAYLLAALAYERFDRLRSWRWYGLAFALFVVAVMCKTVAATLPGALLVIVWWRRGRIDWKRDGAVLIPWLGAGAAAGLFSGWVERTYVGAQGAAFDLTAVQRCLIAGRAFWFYVGKLCWPANLTFIYPRWVVNSADGWEYLFPLGAVAVAAGLWLWRGKARGPLAAYLFFAGSLFPTLGFLNVYAFVFSFVADHWQYLASLGLIAGAAGAAELALAKCSAQGRLIGRGGLGLLVAGLGVLTWRQCRMYRDSETLYRATIERNPAAWMPHSNLGAILLRQGKVQPAIAQYRLAAADAPGYPEIHHNLGDALALAGQSEAAEVEYLSALRLAPNYAAAEMGLGNLAIMRHASNEAVIHYTRALQFRPGDAEEELALASADTHLANDLGNAGRIAEAISRYEEALRLRPDYEPAEANLGLALASSGRMAEAATRYRRALKLDPKDADAHEQLGAVLRALGQNEDGLREFQIAAQLRAGASP